MSDQSSQQFADLASHNVDTTSQSEQPIPGNPPTRFLAGLDTIALTQQLQQLKSAFPNVSDDALFRFLTLNQQPALMPTSITSQEPHTTGVTSSTRTTLTPQEARYLTQNIGHFHGDNTLDKISIHEFLTITESNVPLVLQGFDLEVATQQELKLVFFPLLRGRAHSLLRQSTFDNYTSLKRILYREFGYSRQAIKHQLDTMYQNNTALTEYLQKIINLYEANRYLEQPLQDIDISDQLLKGLAIEYRPQFSAMRASKGDSWPIEQQFQYLRTLSHQFIYRKNISNSNATNNAIQSNNSATGANNKWNSNANSNKIQQNFKPTKQAHFADDNKSTDTSNFVSDSDFAYALLQSKGLHPTFLPQAPSSMDVTASQTQPEATPPTATKSKWVPTILKRNSQTGQPDFSALVDESNEATQFTDESQLVGLINEAIKPETLHNVFESVLLGGPVCKADEVDELLTELGDFVLASDSLEQGDMADAWKTFQRMWQKRPAHQVGRNKTRTVADIVERITHSFPVTRLAQLDANIRKYLLYKLLRFAREKAEVVSYPKGLALNELDKDSYDKLLLQLQDDSKGQYDLPKKPARFPSEKRSRTGDSSGDAHMEEQTSFVGTRDCRQYSPASKRHYCFTMAINDNAVTAHWDGGSAISMISIDLVEKLGLKVDTSFKGSYWGANKISMQYAGVVRNLKLRLHEQLELQLSALRVNPARTSQLIIGNDLFKGPGQIEPEDKIRFEGLQWTDDSWELQVRDLPSRIIYAIKCYPMQPQDKSANAFSFFIHSEGAKPPAWMIQLDGLKKQVYQSREIFLQAMQLLDAHKEDLGDQYESELRDLTFRFLGHDGGGG